VSVGWAPGIAFDGRIEYKGDVRNPILGIARWIVGLPPRSRAVKWTLRLVLLAFIILIGAFLWRGPGVLLILGRSTAVMAFSGLSQGDVL